MVLWKPNKLRGSYARIRSCRITMCPETALKFLSSSIQRHLRLMGVEAGRTKPCFWDNTNTWALAVYLMFVEPVIPSLHTYCSIYYSRLTSALSFPYSYYPSQKHGKSFRFLETSDQSVLDPMSTKVQTQVEGDSDGEIEARSVKICSGFKVCPSSFIHIST